MSATIHRLFPIGRDSAPEALNHPLIGSLRERVQPVLANHLRALFEGADDSLFMMSQRAPSAEEQRLAFDTMRRLRLERERIEQEFTRALDQSFEPAAAAGADDLDLDRFAVQQTEELEEKIAVGNLATKLETLHRDVLMDVQSRMQYLIRHLGVPVSRHALSPDSLCNAFKASLRGLDLGLPVRLLLYKLFDQFCTSRLGEIYASVLDLFDRAGVVPAPVARSPVSGGWSPYGPPPVAAEDPGALELPTLDAATHQALRAVHDPGSGYRPPDAAFAGELLKLADAEAGGRPSVGRVAPAQRISLVGQMCNEILADPHLPPAMRPLFERLRFPLVKIALADGSFFSNRAHPVRRLVAEAAETAAASRVASPAVVRRLEERLRHIAEQIDLSASFVRPQLRHLLPLTMGEIANFLDQQREESETRRENVLNKVRRTVAQELEVHTLGRKPGPGLVQFLRIGWGPLMAARLLRDGMNSRPWIDAINRLVQVLIVMDAVDRSPDHLAARERLVDVLATDLQGVGMRDDRVDGAIAALRQAYAELDQRLSSLTPEDRQRASLQLLSPAETEAVMAEFPSPGSAAWRAASSELSRPPLDPELRLEPPPGPDRLPGVEDPQRPAHGGFDDGDGGAGTSGPEIAGPSLPEPVPMSPATRPAESPDPRPSNPTPPAPDRPEPDPATVAPPEPAHATAPEIGAGTEEIELLVLILPAESWFRVFDAARAQTLWLKVSRFYPEHGSVGFTGFDAKQALSVRTTELLDDLVTGRSEPVNASPVQAEALAELRRRRAG